MTVFTILGAGMMGSAMAFPLRDAGYSVRLVGTPLDDPIIHILRATGGIHPRLQRALPEGVGLFDHSQIAQAVTGADAIIGGVSSFGVDWLAQTLLEHLHPTAHHQLPVISITKGLEDQSNGDLLTLPDALTQRMTAAGRDCFEFYAIGGPCIAHELAARRPTAVMLCGGTEIGRAVLERMLRRPYYHIRASDDLAGVETCAALKNAYALAVGLAVGRGEQLGDDGLARYYNPQAALFGQALTEMGRLCRLNGASEDALSGLPGAGDLYVTVFGGRTVALGKLLGQGVPFSEARQRMKGVTLESVEIVRRVARALPKLAQRGLLRLEDFPLLLHLAQMIEQDAALEIPWDRFYR